MSDDNEQKPLGYGHDKKGVAGGVAKDEGRVHVAHKAPVSWCCRGSAVGGSRIRCRDLR
jgi:hypothetical protein